MKDLTLVYRYLHNTTMVPVITGLHVLAIKMEPILVVHY